MVSCFRAAGWCGCQLVDFVLSRLISAEPDLRRNSDDLGLTATLRGLRALEIHLKLDYPPRRNLRFEQSSLSAPADRHRLPNMTSVLSHLNRVGARMWRVYRRENEGPPQPARHRRPLLPNPQHPLLGVKRHRRARRGDTRYPSRRCRRAGHAIEGSIQRHENRRTHPPRNSLSSTGRTCIPSTHGPEQIWDAPRFAY